MNNTTNNAWRPKSIKTFGEEDDRMQEGKKERETEPEGPRRTGTGGPEPERV